jgi:uncharacterized protein YbaP (TraB family)
MLLNYKTGKHKTDDKRLEAGSSVSIRNRAWMKVLIPQLLKGDAFVAVGSNHLPGDYGVIQLLRAEGFSIRALAPNELR